MSQHFLLQHKSTIAQLNAGSISISCISACLRVFKLSSLGLLFLSLFLYGWSLPAFSEPAGSMDSTIDAGNMGVMPESSDEENAAEVKAKQDESPAGDGAASASTRAEDEAAANTSIANEPSAEVATESAVTEVEEAAVIAAPVAKEAEQLIPEPAASTSNVVEENAAAEIPPEVESAVTGEAVVPAAGSAVVIAAPVANEAEQLVPESAASTSNVIEENTGAAEVPADASTTGEAVSDELKTGGAAAAIVVDEKETLPAEDMRDKSSELELAEAEQAVENPYQVKRVEFLAGASLMNFGYIEYDINGAWLDEENGVLPGLLFGGTLYWTNWYASLMLNYHFGDVEYQGQTQSIDPDLSGLPINSRSDTDIFDTTAIAGYQFSALTAYGGLGYYYWRRNIRSTTTDNGLSVAGVLEFYSWTYAILGLNIPVVKNGDFHLNLDVRATRMLDANMEVDFQGFGGFDIAMLNLGEDWGVRLALPWTFRAFGDSSMLTVEPYYTTWNIGRSSVTELTINGEGTGSGVVEPRSETRNYGILMYIRFLM